MKKSFKFSKIILSIITIIITLTFFVSAAVITVNPATDVQRIFSTPNESVANINHGALQSISIRKTTQSLYVAKYSEDNDSCCIYYYSDLTVNSYKKVRIANSGHANGMTLDPYNLYITCQQSSTDPSKVLKIPLSVINNATNNTTISSSLYEKLTAKVPVRTNGVITGYTDYVSTLNQITRFTRNGEFIVNYKINGISVNNYFAYTKAEIATVNGEDILLISDDLDDIFLIENNLAGNNITSQDICYSKDNGFFAQKWYGGCNNDIIWVDIINGTPTTYTHNNKTYNVYAHDNININMTNQIENGKTINKFEIESIAFDAHGGSMYVGVNVGYSTINPNTGNPYAQDDGLFKITRNGNDFTV